MEKKSLFILTLLIFSIGLISAIPGIPHQFYGSVEVNDEPVPDGNFITAIVNGQEYSTITNEGSYGIPPNTFYIRDPNGNNLGSTINFYVGGKEAGTYLFENNALTNLYFSLTTECGDSYCLGEETCSNCEVDCGICTDPPEIFIESPEDKTYDNSKIDVKVYSNQKIIIWMYSINGQEPEVFNPNVTMNLEDGDYELKIIGMNNAYQTGSETVSFKVDIPYDYCGDSECNGDESCSNCPSDCGECQPQTTSGSSGGGGGGGGGFSSFIKKVISKENETNADNGDLNLEISDEEKNENSQEENSEPKKLFSFLTGAVTFMGEKITNPKILTILGIIIIFVVLFFIIRKRRKNKHKYH